MTTKNQGRTSDARHTLHSPSLKNSLDQVVRPEDLSRLGVLAHPVGKLGDVTRGDEDVGERHDGCVELGHVLLDDEVLAPSGEDVGLKRRTGGSVVVKSGDT